MNILFLSQRFLLPMDTGGKIRTGNILKHLAERHDITLISNVERPKDEPFLKDVIPFCTRFVPVPWKEARRRSPRFWTKLILGSFSIYPVNVLNDYSVRLRNVCEELIHAEPFDLAICDFVQSARMFERLKSVPRLMFQHNVESVIMKRHMDQTRHALVLRFWRAQWKKMLRFERDACHRFDRIVAVSEIDKACFENLYGLNHVSTIPTGVDIDFFKPMKHIQERRNSLVFCGSMDWLPNEDAMIFFIRHIYPLVRKKIPDVRLTIVGRNPSAKIKNLSGSTINVKLTGWIKDVRPFLAEASVVIAPIRIGGGTRMKIYEAMAMGKPVVSTTIGVEGLPVQNGETLLIEDHPEAFSRSILELLSNKCLREKIGKNAMNFVRNHFSWPQVAAAFEKICIETSGTASIK